jgi:hypothetical protein
MVRIVPSGKRLIQLSVIGVYEYCVVFVFADLRISIKGFRRGKSLPVN